MRILKPHWARERTNQNLHRDVLARTRRGLGGSMKHGARDATARTEQRWMALIEQGLVDLDTVPTLVARPEDAPSVKCDEVEMYVVRSVESGATIRALIAGGLYASTEVVRAMARLTDHGLLQLV
jgi:hypothetical protein